MQEGLVPKCVVLRSGRKPPSWGKEVHIIPVCHVSRVLVVDAEALGGSLRDVENLGGKCMYVPRPEE